MAISRRSKNSSYPTIERQNLLDLLRQVHLGGIINECLLSVEDGIAEINVVDITNSLIVVIEAPVMSNDEDYELGFGNIDLLIKFLTAIEDDSLLFKVSESQLQISNKNKSRNLSYLLTEPDLISTNLDTKENPQKKILKMTKLSTVLTESFIKDFLTYLGIVEDKTVTLKYVWEETLSFICGKPHEHQFEIFFDTDDAEIWGDTDDLSHFEVKFNGEHLAKILNTINNEEDEEEGRLVKFDFAEGVPVVIRNADSFWALSAISDGEEGE